MMREEAVLLWCARTSTCILHSNEIKEEEGRPLAAVVCLKQEIREYCFLYIKNKRELFASQ